MNGDNLAKIIGSKAFTILTLTLCAVFIMKNLPEAARAIKEMKKRD
jgi:hypothetical protein